MCTLRYLAALAVLLALTHSSAAQQGYPVRLDLGTAATPQDLTQFYSIPPDGRGLPPGKGTYAEGQKVYADTCAVCHGDKLQGIPTPGIGGDKLIGGRGTLATETPVKTIESYWPYATTIFDYTRRAMPWQQPKTLTDDEVYALTAYILALNKIIGENDVMNAETLPKVKMPNRDGFISKYPDKH